jgi:protein gp37
VAEHTGIEWCDKTFNIAWGCEKHSPGCKNCYAERDSTRYGHKVFGPAKTTERRTFGDGHWAEPLKWNRDAMVTGIRLRVFCSSMADWAEDHPTIAAQLPRMWALIRATPWLDWLLLTKRIERVSQLLPDDWGAGYANVWLGTSVENQHYADKRIPHLIAIPAAIRFLSCEPLLGPVDLKPWLRKVREDLLMTDGQYDEAKHEANNATKIFAHPDAWAIHWVIDGGESGFTARPAELDWYRQHRDQCDHYGVPYLLKQLGGRGVTKEQVRGGPYALLDGKLHRQWPKPHPEALHA